MWRYLLMKLFEALYNPITEESGYVTLSIHKSRDGAEKTIDEHKKNEFKKWRKLYKTKESEPYPFSYFQDWRVNEIDVLL